MDFDTVFPSVIKFLVELDPTSADQYKQQAADALAQVTTVTSQLQQSQAQDASDQSALNDCQTALANANAKLADYAIKLQAIVTKFNIPIASDITTEPDTRPLPPLPTTP